MNQTKLNKNPTPNDEVTVMAIQKIIRLMEEREIAQAKDLVGVSDEEINLLETHFNLELPATYRQFLKQFGRSAGFLSPWVAIYYDDLKEIREMFDLSLAQGLEFRLPAKAFVVANFESTFDFILCKGAHDPEVFRVDFRQEIPTSKKFAPSFSEYLEYIVKCSEDNTIPQDLYDESLNDGFEGLMNY